ncbi:MAG: hypothetical protein JO222_09305 [Frankiales bacterium]|nr:hypothetical protein [Frankiales bacterium]
MVTGLVVLVIAGTSLWVYADAKRLGVRKGDSGGLFEGGPAGWAFGCLLLWIVVFPLYLAARPKFVSQAAAQEPPR